MWDPSELTHVQVLNNLSAPPSSGSAPSLSQPSKFLCVKQEEEELQVTAVGPGTAAAAWPRCRFHGDGCVAAVPDPSASQHQQSPACRPPCTSPSSCRPCRPSRDGTCLSAGSSTANCCRASSGRRPTPSSTGASSRLVRPRRPADVSRPSDPPVSPVSPPPRRWRTSWSHFLVVRNSPNSSETK